MIKIEIENKKTEIKRLHKKDFRSEESYDRLRNKLASLNIYTNFIGWFNNNGTIDNQKIERLLCSDSKRELTSIINEIEPLIANDAVVRGATVKQIKKVIEGVFEELFDGFSTRNWAYNFLKLLDSNVCPYCNRNYTFTVVKKQKPELDHYFPKSIYPYLAVSIFNLVPCCSNCNKGKSSHHINVNNQSICYPYEESFDEDITFEIVLNEIEALFDDKKLLYVHLTGDTIYDEKIRAYNEAFKIDELYKQHTDYVREIIKKVFIFSDDFLETIYNCFPQVFSSMEEVKRTIYANYLGLDDSGKRPLSKLTQDLINELRP